MRGLGAALLSAIEKGDGEQLALLRQAHEIKIQKLSAGGSLPAMEAGAGSHRIAAEEPRQRVWSVTATTNACSASARIRMPRRKSSRWTDAN